MAPRSKQQSAKSQNPGPGVLRRRLVTAVVTVMLATLVAPVTASFASTSVADELAAAHDEAQAIASELAAIETNLAVLEADVERFDAEIAEVKDELAGMEEEVRQIAVQRYVAAGNGPITLGDDPLTHQRADVLLSAVQRDSNQTMERYEAARDRLEASNTALADRLDEQVRQREEMAKRLADLDEELTRLEQLHAQAEAEQARIEAERRQAAALRATTTTTTTTTPTSAAAVTPTTVAPAITTTTAAPAPTSTTAPTTTTAPPPTTSPDPGGGTSPPPSGGILCPVQGVSVFVDTFGAPRSGGRRHMGVDMLAKTGTPAIAPVSGTVTHRGNSIGGLSYHLDGDDGNYYYGTHLSAYGAEGRVEAGTVIGYVGDTGNAAGTPHLHFEIHPGGRGNAINPYPAVRAACG